MEIKEILNRSLEFKYMLLSRMQQDCKYCIDINNIKYLWGITVNAHIKTMNAIYNDLTNKPKWITKREIKEYQKKLNLIK